MNPLDRILAAISPRLAFRRLQYRELIAYYDAAKPSRYRRQVVADPSPDTSARFGRAKLRALARDLERNHDIARGLLNVMVASIVGRGIAVEPQPLQSDDDVDIRIASRLRRLWRNWQRTADITGRGDLALLQRLACRTWLRDGEVFAQLLVVDQRDTAVPLAVELFEGDRLADVSQANVVDGIELDDWGRPVAYHLRETAEDRSLAFTTRRVPADRILHLALTDRIGQTRGVSIFASIATRLQDLRDYEEAERIAAKVAASMTALIKKGGPDMYVTSRDADGVREMQFRPGQIFDDLRPGESVEVIDTKRPNNALSDYRAAMLRAVAAGAGVSFSSLAKQYDGTYSAQRQELVEQYSQYALLSDHFIAQFLRPIYRRFVAVAVASGALRLPPSMTVEDASNAVFIPPAIPWVDPEKEANAWRILDEAGYASPQEIIRRRGLDPDEILRQRREWSQHSTTARARR